jgi:isopentenyl-diphosphate delta-isomerase type 1
MAEMIDVFDAQGAPLGLALRDEAHRKGLWHRAVNVFLFRSDGRLLIQKRSRSKDVWPGTWDLSAAEHLQPGETFLEGAIRGLREELAIDVEAESMHALGGVFPSKLEDPDGGIRDYEFQQSFRVTTDQLAEPDFEEVAELAVIELSVLKAAFMSTPAAYTPWFRSRARAHGFV